MQVYFTVNVGRKLRDSSWCPLNRGGLLNTSSAKYRFDCNEFENSKSHFRQFSTCISKPSWNSSNGYDFLKGTRKWLKGDDLTTFIQQGACVNETQEVPSFRKQIFQRLTGSGTQDRENIDVKKKDSTTGPSQTKSKICEL